MLLAAAGCDDDASAPSTAPGVTDPSSPTAPTDPTDPVKPLDPQCVTDADCVGSPLGPVCQVATGVCEAMPAGNLIGYGDVVPTLTLVWQPDQPTITPDFEFHPTRDELWIVNRREIQPGECTFANISGPRCVSLQGFTTIIARPGQDNQNAFTREDVNSWHFMRIPSAIAMGDNDAFGTCAEFWTGNFEDDPTMFIGPTLWSSDFSIYTQPTTLNGSHLDMLHATPWCMGMAHASDNAYWLFNGHVGSLDFYDFNEPHVPGGDDHSDGEIFRYVEGQLKRQPNVPSHMEVGPDGWLYVNDTGNQRVVRLDPGSGELGAPFEPVYEPLAGWGYVNNATLEVVVPPGRLQQPSGLTMHDGTLYVGDHATGRLHAFATDGSELRSFDTGLPPGSLSGLDVGRDGKLWAADMKTGAIYRLDL